MNLDQFMQHSEQRDRKLQKRTLLGKMNRLTSEPKVKKILKRFGIKRQWLDTPAEKSDD